MSYFVGCNLDRDLINNIHFMFVTNELEVDGF